MPVVIPARGRIRTRVLTVLGAIGAAAALWVIATLLDTDLKVAMNDQPARAIGLPIVIVAGLVASAAGWTAAAVLERYANRPRTFWMVLAVTVLALSFIPVATADTSAAARTVLALMHVAVAVVLIAGLRPTIPKGPSSARRIR
ncbi:DUF6069 family protein [Nocardia brasiliensis]